MKRILYPLLLLLIFGCDLNSILLKSIEFNRLKYSFIETENYGIRNKPILNREYLIFLCWQIDVYGDSFPRRILEMLPQPDLLTQKHQGIQISYEQVFDELENEFFKGYVLNPKYLNYPVIGLTSRQIYTLQKWMSDRYNENVLIESGFLNFNPYQRDEDCFVLESYLINQYQGDARYDKKIYWKDNRFLPTFRLPYQYELNFLKLNLKNRESVREYKFNSKDFLSRWDKHFISVNNSKNEISLNLRRPFSIKNEKSIELSTQSIKDEVLNKENPIFTKLSYLDEAEYNEKDKYGMQSFIIIGENNFNRPIVANQINTQNDTVSVDKIFWLTYSKIIDFEYWPRK
jgi:hypothetical protein